MAWKPAGVVDFAASSNVAKSAVAGNMNPDFETGTDQPYDGFAASERKKCIGIAGFAACVPSVLAMLFAMTSFRALFERDISANCDEIAAKSLLVGIAATRRWYRPAV